MSIQKKSLISTLKTAKKAKVAADKGEKQVSAVKVLGFKGTHLRTMKLQSLRMMQ